MCLQKTAQLCLRFPPRLTSSTQLKTRHAIVLAWFPIVPLSVSDCTSLHPLLSLSFYFLRTSARRPASTLSRPLNVFD